MMGNYLILFLRLLDDIGVDSQAVVRATGVTLQQLERSSQADAIVQQALRETDMEGLGLSFGQRLNITSHGVFGYALMSSANVGDALKLLLQYNRILVPEMTVELVSAGEEVALRGSARQLRPEVERFFIESFFTAVLTSAAFLLGEQEVDLALRLDYPAPSYADRYLEFFGPAVQFNATASELVVARSTLAIPITTANAAAETIFLGQCDALLKQLGDKEAVSARVQHLLLRRRGDFPGVTQVASQLHMSVSTLHRKLQGEGSSFQSLLDQVRYHLAGQYLVETQLPVAEIGRLVGYDDVTNFRRAFRRWSATTPSLWRSQSITTTEHSE